MTNSGKDKGDRGEREVQELLRGLLSISTIRRALGAGRKDDVGDIHGVPNTVIQVAWRRDIASTIVIKLREVEQQRQNARKRFAVVFVRRNRVTAASGDSPWIVAMTPIQFARLWKYAQIGLRHERELRRASTSVQPAAKIPSHVRHRATRADPTG